MTAAIGKEARTATAVDRQSFRDAMSRFGAAVHVVTTDGPAGRGGVTMTAVASVTDRPPTLLVCLNQTSAVNAMIRGNGAFCVSTLPAGADAIADAFAGRDRLPADERFALAEWTVLATGAPALDAARVSLDCRVVSISEVGTHSVILGEVVAIRMGEAGGALVYLDRSYKIVR
jgi:flavin reductase